MLICYEHSLLCHYYMYMYAQCICVCITTFHFLLLIVQEPPEYKLMGYTPLPFPELDSYRPPGLARKLKEGALVSRNTHMYKMYS